MRVGSPRRPLVSSRFGGKTQTSSRREGEWLKRGERFMSPPSDWELKWGVTRPFCQLHNGYGICIHALHCYTSRKLRGRLCSLPTRQRTIDNTQAASIAESVKRRLVSLSVNDHDGCAALCSWLFLCLRVLMGFRECSYTAWLSRSPMFFIVCVCEC